MIRFIDIGHQLYLDDSEPKEFAFYCTATNKFETFSGEQVWNSIEDFKNDFNDAIKKLPRYLSLIPNEFK